MNVVSIFENVNFRITLLGTDTENMQPRRASATQVKKKKKREKGQLKMRLYSYKWSIFCIGFCQVFCCKKEKGENEGEIPCRIVDKTLIPDRTPVSV